MGADKKMTKSECRMTNECRRLPANHPPSPGYSESFREQAGAAGANRRDNILIKDKSFALIRVIRG
jgi:hypothetical protein